MSYPNAVFQGCRVSFEAVMTWFAFSNPITFRKWQSQDVSRCMLLVGQNTPQESLVTTNFSIVLLPSSSRTRQVLLSPTATPGNCNQVR